MKIRAETEAFVKEIEVSSGRRFQFREELTLLKELAEAHMMQQAFDDLTFQAKFVTNAAGILQRAGSNTDETRKLSGEMEEGMKRIATLLGGLLENAPDEVRSNFSSRFLSMTQESLQELLSLLRELRWIKNYALDKKRSV